MCIIDSPGHASTVLKGARIRQVHRVQQRGIRRGRQDCLWPFVLAAAQSETSAPLKKGPERGLSLSEPYWFFSAMDVKMFFVSGLAWPDATPTVADHTMPTATAIAASVVNWWLSA